MRHTLLALAVIACGFQSTAALAFAEAPPPMAVYLIFAPREGEQFEEYSSPAMEQLILQ